MNFPFFCSCLSNRIINMLYAFIAINLMQQLSEKIGITIIENQIVDFEKHFWTSKMDF
jgi:hypothetical protein